MDPDGSGSKGEETSLGSFRRSSSGHFVLTKCVRVFDAEVFCTIEEPEPDGTIAQKPLTSTFVHVRWTRRPENILLVKKPHDAVSARLLRDSADYLREHGYQPFVEYAVHDEFPDLPYMTQEISEEMQLVVTFGGDGTILWVSKMFPRRAPPVVSFHTGTLGFLAAFDVNDYKSVFETVTSSSPIGITLRMRLLGAFMKKDHLNSILPESRTSGSNLELDAPVEENHAPSSSSLSARQRLEVYKSLEWNTELTALNEILIERSSGSMLLVDAYSNGKYVTTVQADGIIVATTTGSTAYSMSAGGSMIHPSVPCILLTPICPHSLSFRPIVIPDSTILQFHVPDEARTGARVSIDGRVTCELQQGDSFIVRMSDYPLPCVRAESESDLGMEDSWFTQLASCLHWNVTESVLKKTNNRK